jgi:glycosyltransferase involved in cell wall biosynthesis
VSSRLLRWHARWCHAVIAISLSVAEDARAALGSRVAVHVVPNGVDLEAFSSEGPAVDVDRLARLPPAREGTLKVGLIATFARWKGHDVFLRAIAELPGTAPVRGYVVGGPVYDTEGSERSMDELHATATRLGLGDRVGFVGFVDDVAAVMRGLDVVVHASTQPEPFGRVIVEAMAVGRPVIVSFAGGVKEIVEVDHTALIHAPGDWRGLRDSIMRLADDVTLRERLAKAARAAVERRFDRRRPSALLVPLYRTLAPSIP